MAWRKRTNTWLCKTGDCTHTGERMRVQLTVTVT